MKKYFAFLSLAAMLALTACDCTDGSCGAGKESGATDMNAADSGMVQTDVIVTDLLTSQLGEKTKVYFDFDKSTVKAEFEDALKEQAAWLSNNPGTTVVVAGHCDERGTREYNLALGERRANAVKNYLVSLGVDAARITVVSYGKDKPVVLGSGPQIWAMNRVSITGQQL